METIKFEIPEPLPLMNKWQRMHWQKRRRINKGFSWMVREALGPWNKDPITACEIRIERYSAGTPDPDAIVAKPLLDALVVRTKRNPYGLGIILDDNPSVILKLTIETAICPRKQGKTVIEIAVKHHKAA